MKRSEKIDRQAHLKRPDPEFRGRLLPLVAAVSLAGLMMTGCSDNSAVDTSQQVELFSSVPECAASGDFTEQQCNTAYNEARRQAEEEGPKFSSRSDCETEFGVGQCEPRSGGFFGPFLTGFVLSRMLDSMGQYRNAYQPYPVYLHQPRGRAGEYVFGDGTVFGPRSSHYGYMDSTRISRNTGVYSSKGFKTRPQVTPTRTRDKGGFGSFSSSKSRWGGGSSRSSRGWGG